MWLGRLLTGFLTDFTILLVPNSIIMQHSSTYYLHCYIAGLQYYEVLEVWKKLEIGQSLKLIPEPDNRYDEHAFVVAFQDKKLGYLPRSQNKTVSTILQAVHDAYEARTQSLYSQNPIYERIEICVRVKHKE